MSKVISFFFFFNWMNIRLSGKFLSFYKVIIGDQQFLFYIILGNEKYRIIRGTTAKNPLQIV